MKNKKLLKFSLALTNAVTMADVAGVSAAMGAITKAYEGTNPILINSIATVPILTMVLFSLVAGRLSAFISKKTIMLVGLVLFTVGGVLPLFNDNIWFVLIVRAFSGIGAGFVLPTFGSIITDFFEGEERAQVMGFGSSVAAIMMIFIAVGGGVLASINWHYVFITYAVGVIIFIFAAVGIPQSAPDRSNANKMTDSAEKPHIGKALVTLSTIAFLLYLIHPVTSVKSAVFYMEEGIGDAAFAGISGAVMILGIAVSGFFFNKIYIRLKKFTLPIGLLLCVVTFVLFSLAASKPMCMAAMFIYGLATTLIYPYLIMQASFIATKSKSSQTLIISIVTSVTYFGQVLNILYIALVAAVLNTNMTRPLFVVTGIILGVIFVGLLVRALLTKKETEELAAPASSPKE